MTLASISLHKIDLPTFSIKHLAIHGSHLLMNCTASLNVAESPFKTYEMLGRLTILTIAGPLSAAGGEG